MTQKNSFAGQTWKNKSFSLIPQADLTWRKWGLRATWQSAKESLEGQILTEKPSMALCELAFRPKQGLTLTAGIRYPFYDAWTQTVRTCGTPLITRVETESIVDNANMVYFSVVYNLSFGTGRAEVKAKLHNEDSDTGVLGREK